jgi:hypothetical protein
MTTRSSESACSECSKTTPELAVIGEASNGAEAVELARELAPQVVVMDLEMPIMDGIQAARHILRLAPATAILMLSLWWLSEVFGTLPGSACWSQTTRRFMASPRNCGALTIVVLTVLVWNMSGIGYAPR